MMTATSLSSVPVSCEVQLTGIVGSGVPAREHPASPGSALEDLDQFPCAGPAGAAFFVARAGQGVPLHARSTRTRGSAETRLPAKTVRGDRQAVACHARQRFGGPIALFPRVGLGGWDLSRCPLARVRRSTSSGLLRATSGGAQAVAVPPRHA